MGKFATLAKCIALAVLAAGLMGGWRPATASPDWELVELREDLKRISRDLIEHADERKKTLPEVMADIDWAMPQRRQSRTPPLTNGPQATLGWMDARLALAPIHQIYGAKGAGPIKSALGNYGTEAVLVEGGVATLELIRDGLTNRQWIYDLPTDRHVLRVPLVVAQDATLRLSPGEFLALSREDGAFIVNLGRLEVIGAAIHATETPNAASERFRPFVTSLGAVHLEDASFADLGFGNSVKYSGLSVLAHPTFQHQARTIVRATRFDRLVTVSVVGIPGPEIEDNRFFSMTRNALLVSRSAHAEVAGNLFSGPSPTNAVRIMHGSDAARLIGNVVLEGARAGFLVSGGSDDVVVRNNLIWHRNGGGVKLSAVRCGLVESNLILDDKQKGVEVRTSPHATVRDNMIIGNRNAGVWVSAQKEANVTYVSGNLLRENGSGLSTVQGGDIALSRNDMRNQFPQFLDGEVTQQFRAIVRDLEGQTPLLMNAQGTREAKFGSARECGTAQR